MLWQRRYVVLQWRGTAVFGYVDNLPEMWPGRGCRDVMQIVKSGLMARAEFMKELPHA
jgi:hypothetical protein